jgi:GH35 family endo-1,4-beta-xylanase
MEEEKRWITEKLARKAFEDIIRTTFEKYKDNLMCSQDTMDDIIVDATQEIREQLQGLKRDYIKKESG